MLSDLGFDERTHRRNVYLHEGMAISATAHQAGTAKFGSDPESSVLDLNCKAHELDNLYVIDSSFFVSIGAVNPTLTIIANTLRVGTHLLERMG
jgi:choline dehydrogenase-like flavoprotein